MQTNHKLFFSELFNPQKDSKAPILAKHRSMYIISVALITGFILNHYVYLINTKLDLTHDWAREYYVCLGQIIWQYGAITLLAGKYQIKYLSNMSTVSLLGGILLLPMLLYTQYTTPTAFLLIAYFAGVVTFMFFEHIRRCKLLSLPFAMTISWVAYRTVVLGLILWSLF